MKASTQPTHLKTPEPTPEPAAEMVYFRRRGSDSEDRIPVLPGTAERNVDPVLITRKVPLFEGYWLSKAFLDSWKEEEVLWKEREAELVDRVKVLERENANLLMANRDCVAWFEALRPDHEKALKALDELARLGNGSHYGTSEGNLIAIAAINSMID